MNKIQKSYFSHSNIAVTLMCALVLASGCERQAGPVIDTKTARNGDFEFLIIRTKTSWYDEFGVSYWCRSPLTINARRTGWPDTAEPDEYVGQGWRGFFGYTNGKEFLASDNPIANLKIIDNRTAYLDKSLTMTFDGCRTRTFFNLNPGAYFKDTMLGKGIRFPDLPHNHGTTFLQNMKVHEGGGCFEINPDYVDERKQYFYCSSDLGKTWTLETERKQTLPIAPPPASKPVPPPAPANKTQVTKPS